MEEPITPIPLEERIRTLLDAEPGAEQELDAVLEEAEPFEIADALYHFALSEQQTVLNRLHPEVAAAVLLELNESALEQLFGYLPVEKVALYINLLEPDEAADLIHLMDPDLSDEVMLRIDPSLRDEVSHLLTYDPETAGGIMDPDVVQVRVDATVERAVETVRRYVERVGLDDFFSIFVVNEKRQLVGVVPTWRMMLAPRDEVVGEVMEAEPIHVRAELDQEEVAHIVMDHDLVVVPVVDNHMHLLGRITIDDVVDVIQEEHEEDLSRMAGTGGEFVHEATVFRTFRTRAPWLAIAFTGQFIAALVMRSREDLLVVLPQLAFFIPVVNAMGGNTGVQSASLVIQGLASGELRLAHFWRRLGRELLVAICFGLAFGSLLMVGSILLTGNLRIGLATALAITCTITLASMLGIIIPMVLKALDQDPALATGPFITTMNDVLGILLYLSIGYVLVF